MSEPFDWFPAVKSAEVQHIKNKNAHRICTWDEYADCANCDLEGRLLCRCTPDDVKLFVSSQAPYFFISYIGMGIAAIMTGSWWPIVAYSIVGLAFLGPVEMWVLCRHCPYYAEEEKKLHCIAPNPFPKLFSYNPEPLCRLEKRILIAFAAYLLAFPALVEAYGVWFLASHLADHGIHALFGMGVVNLATIIAAIHFYRVLTCRFCASCVNLSCPFNRVSEEIAERYLDKNPIMKAAWKYRGYKNTGKRCEKKT